MTAPFDEDTPTLLTQTHRQQYAARATHPDWAEPMVLDVQDLTVGWEETRSPRCTASLTVRVPESQEALDLLDPLTGVRVEIDAGYIRPGGVPDVHTIANLGLRERGVARGDNTMDLTAYGDEALVIDNAPSALYSVDSVSTTQAMIDILNTVITPPPTVSVTCPNGPPVAVSPVTDKVDTLKDLADRIGADVYDDGLRTWIVETRPEVVGTADAVLGVGTTGTITASRTTLSRDDGWANRVYLEYIWRPDGADVDSRVLTVVSITDGPYAPAGPASAKTYYERRDVPTTQEEATASATALLRRLASKGRGFRLSAVSALWLRPGMTVTVQLPTGPQERHLVSSVTFNATRQLMDVVTRLPRDITITGE